MSSVVKIHSHREYEEAIQPSARLVVVLFTSPRCGPCLHIAAPYASLSFKYPSVGFFSVDTNELKDVTMHMGVRGTPSFFFYKGGKRLDTFMGADIAGLEAMIVRLKGSDRVVEEEQGLPVGMMDLMEFVRRSHVECLNQNEKHTCASMFQRGDSTYLESEADEELLLHIPFTRVVRIHSIALKGPDDGRAPKSIRLFINQPTLGFSEAASSSSVQDLDVTPEQVMGARLIPLKFVRFQRVNVLTIFVKANQGGRDTSALSFLQLVGQPLEATKMEDFKRVAGRPGDTE